MYTVTIISNKHHKNTVKCSSDYQPIKYKQTNFLSLIVFLVKVHYGDYLEQPINLLEDRV